ncbi:GntR family transcriptional regulator [Microbacterium resistens]|uniref:GntR family transcriptional regulator n=1 Tax=Microbacterium resistens TaxID=156977 RepID=UPI000AF4A4AB|nr:GntR family transcriptional regulator [Microbacterium resistens]
MDEADECSATERVQRAIRDEIIDGTRPGGSRIVEATEAARFSVSRIPVRKAIRGLIHEGLVDRLPRHGGLVHVLSRTDVADIAELHSAFDRLAVRQAAVRRTDADLRRFRADVEDARRAVAADDTEQLRRAGLAFRTHSYESTRNPILLEIHAALLSRTRRMFALADPALTTPLPFYERFERAFADGDPDAAETTMVELAESSRAARHARVLRALDDDAFDLSLTAPETEAPPLHGEDRYAPEHVMVHDRLQRQIIDGLRAPGSVLSERLLAEEFGVSRIPVGEAIEMLTREGLATSGSSRVASRVRGLRDEERDDLFDVGAAMDVLATRLAAQRPLPRELAALKEKLVAEHRVVPGDTKTLVETIFDFRTQIYDMCGNLLLVEMNRLIEGRMRLLVSQAPLASVVLRGHRLLYEAIASRDTRLAELVYRDVFTRADRRGQILANAPRDDGQ